MQGRILELDSMGAGGTILGNDGKRYAFVIGEWRAADKAVAGGLVDFILGDNTMAREVFPMPGNAAASPAAPVQAGTPWVAQGAAPRQTVQAVRAAQPLQAATMGGGNSVVLGLLGIVCLFVGFAIPFIPTIAAFILGLVGADSGKRHNNMAGIVLSRISWIGALVLFIIAILFIGFFVSIMALLLGLSPEEIARWSGTVS